MLLTILYAHTGDAYSVDPNLFTTVDELKAWIAEQFKVPVSNQILTTIKGTLVKQQNLVTEKELFLYSRQYITPSSSTPPPNFPIPSFKQPSSPPDRPDAPSDISSWRSLFSTRLSWSTSLLSHATTLAAFVDSTVASIAVIDRSLSAATTNLDSHVKTSAQKYDELKTWAFEVLDSQEQLLRSWEPSVEKLSRIPIHKEVFKIVMAEHARSGRSNIKPTGTLLDIISLPDVRSAAKELEVIAREFHTRVQNLGDTLESIRQQSSSLTSDIHRGWKKNEDPNPSEASGLLSDIRVLVAKIQQDTEHISALPNSSKSLTSISKIAYTHTKEYLPALITYTAELAGLVQACVKRKNVAAGFTVQSLQAISKIEQRLYTDLTSVVKKCEGEYEEKSEGGYQTLVLVTRLPSVYSSFLVECVRRREWGEKMGQDGAKLAEELAGLKEEEEKRRRKWWRSATQGGEVVVSFLPQQQEEVSGGGISVEVNFSAETSGWPVVGRADLDVLLNALKGVEAVEGLVRELAQGIIDLDKPTRRQRKATTPALATRAFKMGSIHEAAMVSSSFLVGGVGGGVNDDATIKRLREDRARLEERARMYESRVRKLEDLLHRQRPGNAAGVQFGSSPAGNNGSITTIGVGSPLSAEPMSRNSSQGTIITPMNGGVNMTSNRRISVTEDASKALTMRIVTLENDLEKEREARQRLEAEATKRFEDEKKGWSERMMEVDSTKKDLLANIQAQQQEFNSERKELQDKIVEVEEQLEGWKTRVEEVYAELDRMEESKALEAARNSGLGKEVEEMQRELEEYKALLEEHEGKMGLMIRENEEMRVQAEKAAAGFQEELRQVKAADAQKAGEIDQWEKKALEREEEHSLVIVELERKLHALETAGKARDAENAKLALKLGKATKELDTFRSKVSGVLIQPINESHHELARTQILDAEELTARLESLVSGLRHEIASGEEAVREATERNRVLQSRLEARTVKTKDLTQKLYTHNARSGQLLESLGFKVIVDDDGQTQIVRISRGAASGGEGDQMAKSISMSTSLPPLPRDLEARKDVELLYWMDNEDSEVESEKYATFLNSIGTFDLDAFGDAVTKRVREAEHMARKWQKQCRDYRDKYHRAAAEASEKIAYRTFKEGDLALFLPTRNQVTRPWAAFNVGAPHYFLREVEGHRLKARDWLLARISKVEQRVVDLSKNNSNGNANNGTGSTVATIGGDKASSVSSDTGAEVVDEDNPFQLSDGLRWYLLDAVEEGKLGAPSTPGLGSSTVAAANVDAKGSTIRSNPKKIGAAPGAKKTLTKSLAQSGGPVVGGETSSIRSRESRDSGRKGSAGSAGPRPATGGISIGILGGSAVDDG